MVTLLGQVIFRPANVAGWPSGTKLDRQQHSVTENADNYKIWSGIIPMVYKPKGG